jgi:hypothetical protein
MAKKRREPGPLTILAWIVIAGTVMLLIGCGEVNMTTALDVNRVRRVDIIVNNLTRDSLAISVNGENLGIQGPGQTRYRPMVEVTQGWRRADNVEHGTVFIGAVNRRTGIPARQRQVSVQTDRPEGIEFRDTDFR